MTFPSHPSPHSPQVDQRQRSWDETWARWQSDKPETTMNRSAEFSPSDVDMCRNAKGQSTFLMTRLAAPGKQFPCHETRREPPQWTDLRASRGGFTFPSSRNIQQALRRCGFWRAQTVCQQISHSGLHLWSSPGELKYVQSPNRRTFPNILWPYDFNMTST